MVKDSNKPQMQHQNNHVTKKSKKNTRILKKIPNPLRFISNSSFIFDMTKYQIYLKNINNKSLILLKEAELDILNNIVNNITSQSLDKSNHYINIDIRMYNILKNYKPIPVHYNEKQQFLFNTLKSNKSQHISCRKLSSLYKEKTGKIMSKSYIHNVIKNIFHLRYLKTTVKTNKLLENSYIVMGLLFIKIIARSLKQNCTLIFVDESHFESMNNHFKTFRGKEEQLYCKMQERERNNLILAVSDTDVIYYEINSGNNNGETFLNYMINLNTAIQNKKIVNPLIIMDNCTIHKTSKLREFYLNSKGKYLFNVPYLSSFNAVELAFRNLKTIIYNTIYSNIEIMKEDIIRCLSSPSFKTSLIQNYKNTIINYLQYYNNNKNIKLNTII